MSRTFGIDPEARRMRHTTDDSADVGTTSPRPEEDAADGLRAGLQQERDRHLRTRAEFENYKRRTERDRDVAAREGKRALLLSLVDLADGFDRALAHVDESPESVAEGLHGMQRRLRNLLEAEGVKPFESVGRTFDPNRHEALAAVCDFDGESGTVVDEAGRGYLWNGELLRPARVRVAE